MSSNYFNNCITAHYVGSLHNASLELNPGFLFQILSYSFEEKCKAMRQNSEIPKAPRQKLECEAWV